MNCIVTHMNPDWDAIGSSWLLARFVPELREAEVRFVNTARPDPEVIATAAAVVDTGLVHDPARMRFDHHQPGVPRSVSAVWQVYEFLLGTVTDPEARFRLEAIRALADLICRFDVGAVDSSVEFSRVFGIHAMLGGQKMRIQEQMPPECWNDEFLKAGFAILDDLARVLVARAEAARDYEKSIVYRSADGRVVAHRQGSSQLAFQAGATLVLFEGKPFETGGGALSLPVGMTRNTEDREPHIGTVVTAVLADEENLPPEIRAELERWWLHPDGFYGGRGGPAAPNSTPVTVDVAEIAALVDRTWRRA